MVGSLGLLVLGLVAYGATLDFHVGNLHNALLALTFAGVGLYVLRARPGHRVGQLFVGLGVAAALMYFGRQAGLHSPALPGGAWLAWVSIWLVPLVDGGRRRRLSWSSRRASTCRGGGAPRRTPWSGWRR